MLVKDYQENYGMGWIKMFRSILYDKLWLSGKFTRGQAWIDLLLLAKYKSGYFYLRDVKITYERGQITEGIINLSLRWKWSRNKTQKFINDLEKEQQIEQQKLSIITLITITNYNLYQQNGQQDEQQQDISRTSDDTIEGQQQDTHKKDKKDKKEKNDKNIPPEEEFLAYAKTLQIYHHSLDFQIKAKYKSWVENNWKDGNDKTIRNWKTKLQNTMPYMKKDFTPEPEWSKD